MGISTYRRAFRSASVCINVRSSERRYVSACVPLGVSTYLPAYVLVHAGAYPHSEERTDSRTFDITEGVGV